jgi:hypothetical protein
MLLSPLLSDFSPDHFIVFAIDAFGWYGAIALLLAYGLHSLKAIEAGWLYQVLNLTGAAGVGLAAWMKQSYQPAALEAAWAVIALIAMLRWLIPNRRPRGDE